MKRQLKSRQLRESELEEIFEQTCKSAFQGYGITLVDGENALSGPALERAGVAPGSGAIQMGGETWEKRLGEICRKFVYDKIGEDELYDNFRTKGELSSDLCFSETRDCQLGPKVPKKIERSNKQTSAKKDKKPKQGKTEADADTSKNVDIDLSTFIGKLARKHGLAKAEYTRKRSFSEWEQ